MSSSKGSRPHSQASHSNTKFTDLVFKPPKKFFRDATELYDAAFDKKKELDSSRKAIDNGTLWRQRIDEKTPTPVPVMESLMKGAYHLRGSEQHPLSPSNTYPVQAWSENQGKQAKKPNQTKDIIAQNKKTLGVSKSQQYQQPEQVSMASHRSKPSEPLFKRASKERIFAAAQREFEKSLYSPDPFQQSMDRAKRKRPSSARSTSSSMKEVKYTRPTSRHSEIMSTCNKTLWNLEFSTPAPIAARDDLLLDTVRPSIPKQSFKYNTKESHFSTPNGIMDTATYLKLRRPQEHVYHFTKADAKATPSEPAFDMRKSKKVEGFLVNAGVKVEARPSTPKTARNCVYNAPKTHRGDVRQEKAQGTVCVAMHNTRYSIDKPGNFNGSLTLV